MNLVARLRASLRHQGPGATFFKLWALVADHAFDFRRGTDTGGRFELKHLTITGANRDRAGGYEASRVILLRKVFKKVQPLMPPESVLVDLGCGKGRVLLVAAEFRIKKVRGVEFAHELCELAKRNWAKFQARTGTTTECSIVEADAANYPIHSDENVFFMFNPFDETVMEQVMRNIAASLEERRRKVWIIYYNPRAGQVIERRQEFERLEDFNFWGYQFAVYSNQG